MYLKSLKILALVLLVVLSAKAQRSNIVIGPELNLPSGNSTNASPIGFGGYIKGEIGLTEKFSITGTGAVSSFLGKKFYGSRAQTLSFVPVKAGLKFYTDKDFYFEGQVGAAFPINGGGRTRFAWSPGAGTFIKNKKNNNQLDIGLRYEGWTGKTNISTTTFSFFSLRAGYAFNL